MTSAPRAPGPDPADLRAGSRAPERVRFLAMLPSRALLRLAPLALCAVADARDGDLTLDVGRGTHSEGGAAVLAPALLRLGARQDPLLPGRLRLPAAARRAWLQVL